MSAARRAHRRFHVLLAVLVPVLLHFVLLATGSLAVVPCRILTTCSLAVVPSVLLFHHWLFGCLGWGGRGGGVAVWMEGVV